MKIHNTIFFVLFLLMTCGSCQRHKDTKIFKWTEINQETDSITQAIEWCFYKSMLGDTIDKLIKNLIQASAALDKSDKKVISARSLYFDARNSTVRQDFGTALELAKRGKLLIDSVHTPIEWHKLEALRLSLLDAVKDSIFPRLLEEYAFFQSAKDYEEMAGIAEMIGNYLSSADEYEIALAYYLKADSLFSILRLPRRASAYKMNIAGAYYYLGNKPKADSIMNSLLKDSSGLERPDLYNLFLRNRYAFMGDTSALKRAFNHQKKYLNNNALNATYESLLAWYYWEDSTRNNDSLKLYLGKALKDINHLDDYAYKALVKQLYADVLFHEGKYNEAYLNLDTAMQFRERELVESAPVKISKIYKEKTLSLLSKEYDDYRSFSHIIILSAGGLALIAVMIAYTLYSRHRRKERIKELKSSIESQQHKEHIIALTLSKERAETFIGSLNERLNTLKGDGEIGNKASSVLLKMTREHISNDLEWDSFEKSFSGVFPNFRTALISRCPDLTESQIRLAMFIRMGISSRLIASSLHIQPTSLSQARWRLKSKLGLKPDESLKDYLQRL